jgi:hypothetical protein
MARSDISKEGQQHRFTSQNQPKNRLTRKGIPNRATIYKKLLNLKTNVADPEKRGRLNVTLYEAAALGQIKAAIEGNTRAWQEIQDTLFGKQTINIDLTAEEIRNLTDEELDQIITRLHGTR